MTVADVAGTSDNDNSRMFKIWDCNVTASGKMYDSTSEGAAVCATGLGFSNLANSEMNFKTILVDGASVVTGGLNAFG